MLYQDAAANGDQHNSPNTFSPLTEAIARPTPNVGSNVCQYQGDYTDNCCWDPNRQTDQTEGHPDSKGIQTRGD